MIGSCAAFVTLRPDAADVRDRSAGVSLTLQ